MSVTTIDVIMGRIKVATRESPIAVFSLATKRRVIDEETDKLSFIHEAKLEAFFGATITTKDMIANGRQNFVGLFNRTMDMQAVKDKLRDVIKPVVTDHLQEV